MPLGGGRSLAGRRTAAGLALAFFALGQRRQHGSVLRARPGVGAESEGATWKGIEHTGLPALLFAAAKFTDRDRVFDSRAGRLRFLLAMFALLFATLGGVLNGSRGQADAGLSSVALGSGTWSRFDGRFLLEAHGVSGGVGWLRAHKVEADKQLREEAGGSEGEGAAHERPRRREHKD